MVINPKPFSIQSAMVTVPEEISFATWDSHIDLRGDKIGCKSLGSNTSSVHFDTVMPASYQPILPTMAMLD